MKMAGSQLSLNFVVDAAHGEDGPLILRQCIVYLRPQPVLQDEACPDGAAGGNGKELGRSWVDVWSVHAARFHETHGSGNILTYEHGIVCAGSEVSLSAEAFVGACNDGGVCGRVEIKFQIFRAMSSEDGEAIDCCGGEGEGIDEILGDWWVCGGSSGGGWRFGRVAFWK